MQSATSSQSSSQRPRRTRRAPIRDGMLELDQAVGDDDDAPSAPMTVDEESDGDDFELAQKEGEEEQSDDDDDDADDGDEGDGDEDMSSRVPSEGAPDSLMEVEGSTSNMGMGAASASKAKKTKGGTKRRPGAYKLTHVSEGSEDAVGRYRLFVGERIIGSTARVTKGMDYSRPEQRPIFMPSSMGSQLLRVVEPMTSLQDLGVQEPKVTSAVSQKKQLDVADQSIRVWHRVQHFAQLGEYPEQDEWLVADWAWDAGKERDRKKEKEVREAVRELWAAKGGSMDMVVEQSHRELLQKPGGVFLLGLEGKERGWRLLDDKDAQRYEPPTAQLPDAAADTINSVADLVERPARVDNARGDYSIALDIDDRESMKVKAGTSESLQAFGKGPSGFVYNAGSFVSSLDWAPASHLSAPHAEYLALATSLTSPPGVVPEHAFGERSDAPGAIHVLGLSHGECCLEYKIGIPEGEVRQIKWSPRGWDHRDGLQESQDHGEGAAASPSPRLGLLAAVLSNGKVAIFAPPRPNFVHASIGNGKGKSVDRGSSTAPVIELTPLLELPFHGSSLQPICLDWGSGELLAVGCVNGSVSVWPVGELLRSFGTASSPPSNYARSPPPSHHFRPMSGTITSLSFLNLPRRSTLGRDLTSFTDPAYDPINGSVEGFDPDSPPHLLLVTSLDGTQRTVDLDAPELINGEVGSRREPMYASSFLPAFLGFWLGEYGGDNSARLINPRPDSYGRSHGLTTHRGRVTALAGARSHPLVASGGADGSVKVTNALLAVTRHSTKVDGSVYRLDIQRSTGKLRYVDRISPVNVLGSKEEDDDHDEGEGEGEGRGKSKGKAKAKDKPKEKEKPSPLALMAQNAAWHPAVRVTSVAWCPNLQAPFLLASATAAGLVRVDWLAASHVLHRKQEKEVVVVDDDDDDEEAQEEEDEEEEGEGEEGEEENEDRNGESPS